MAGALIDTHVLLWMLDGSLPRRSAKAARQLAEAITAHRVFVSIGSFLDLRYLVDAGRFPVDVLQKAEEVVQREAFSVVSLDLAVHHAMAKVSREQVPDPFDRIIAATAVLADLPLLTADERIRAALGERAVW
jgi:PIN domain nuclease of toxin-antitoxin system